MLKAAARMKNAKKSIDKVDHSSKLRTNIPAGLATPSPPLGPQLGQVSFTFPLPRRLDINLTCAYIYYREILILPIS